MSTPLPSPPHSPSRSGASSPLLSQPQPSHPKEGLVSRLFITPITFLSFILSLFLVSSHNHSIRTSLHQHPHSPTGAPQPETPTTVYGKVKAVLHALVFKPTASSFAGTNSPYAYISHPQAHSADIKTGIIGGADTWDVKSKDGSKGGDVGGGEWYYHTKQKKMMEAEMADAFRIRKWVLGVLVVGGGALLAVVAVGGCLLVGFGVRVWLGDGL